MRRTRLWMLLLIGAALSLSARGGDKRTRVKGPGWGHAQHPPVSNAPPDHYKREEDKHDPDEGMDIDEPTTFSRPWR